MTNTLFDGLLHEEPKDVASTDKKEAANFKQSLVMVCFRISVWTGTTTEQLSVEDGSESMLRKRIVPSEILKPFTDLRNRAKRFCKQHGETYLNGYVMPADCARMALDELKEIRASFIKQRDEYFAHAYEKMREARAQGIIPRGCSDLVPVPSLKYVLGHIRFNYDAFSLASFKHGHSTSYESFLTDFCQRMSNEAQDIEALLKDSLEIPDALLYRCLELSEKLDTWRRSHPDIGTAAVKLKGAYIVTAQRPKAMQTSEKIIDALDSITRLESIDFFGKGQCPAEDTANGRVQVNVHGMDIPSFQSDSTEPAGNTGKENTDDCPAIAGTALTSETNSASHGFALRNASEGHDSSSLGKDEESVKKWTCSVDSVLARGRSLFIG